MKKQPFQSKFFAVRLRATASVLGYSEPQLFFQPGRFDTKSFKVEFVSYVQLLELRCLL